MTAAKPQPVVGHPVVKKREDAVELVWDSMLRDVRVQPVNVDIAKRDDQVHISRSKKDVVIWYSDQLPFRIQSIIDTATSTKAEPFGRPLPAAYSMGVCSGPAKEDAAGTYKVTIEFKGGGTLDPEVVVEA